MTKKRMTMKCLSLKPRHGRYSRELSLKVCRRDHRPVRKGMSRDMMLRISISTWQLKSTTVRRLILKRIKPCKASPSNRSHRKICTTNNRAHCKRKPKMRMTMMMTMRRQYQVLIILRNMQISKSVQMSKTSSNTFSVTSLKRLISTRN